MNKLAAATIIAMTIFVTPGAVSAAEVPYTEIVSNSRQDLSAWPRIRDTILGRNKHRYHRDRYHGRYRHDHHHHYHHHDRHHRR